MALFDRKPLVIGGQIVFSPKDLSSGEKLFLVTIKIFQVLMMFGGAGVAAGLVAGMIRYTFDFPWSWGVFFMWAIVAGFAVSITTVIEFLSWWWISDEEAQRFRDYHKQMEKQMETFMRDNGVEYEPLASKQDTTKKEDGEKAKVIPLPTTTSRKKPNGNEEDKD